ncbi:MAG: N-acyl-D-amino-acid deacylase family protein [Bacillota bacterium]|jgi:N-acyl-D-amino-acid deacylase
MYDYILKGGTIVDGSGAPSYQADVAIKDGKIAKIAPEITCSAAQVIDVSGLTVAPGFIDIHSHSDTIFLLDDRCEGKLYQGVTTELAGQCGSTIYPCPADRMENIRGFAGARLQEFASASFQEFMDKVKAEGKRMSTNLISLIGHGALRCGVMGYENRKATPEELREMQSLLDRDMQAGAWGLSLGLGYTPGVSSDQEELNALGEVVARYDGIITSHMRDQGTNTPTSLEEMYEINRQTGAHVHIAHFKASGKANWGRAPEFVQNVAAAREAGINVTVDVYPYTAASSGITNSFPKWAIQGGKAMAIARLKGEERQQIMDYLNEHFQTQADGDRLYMVTTNGRYPVADGKTVWQLSQELGLSMAETIAKVTLETDAQTTCISFAMSEEDVDYMLSQNDYAIGSDGRGLPLAAEENQGKPHPRNFGTFPRFLRLAREKGYCSLEQAVHRMTGLSADILGLSDRGLLQEGKVADITVFDPANVTDKATFADPFQKPVGIEHVFISGQPALLNGQQTGERLGQFILKQ